MNRLKQTSNMNGDYSSLILMTSMLIASVADIGGNKHSAIYPVLRGMALLLLIWGTWESTAIHNIVDTIIAHS